MSDFPTKRSGPYTESAGEVLLDQHLLGHQLDHVRNKHAITVYDLAGGQVEVRCEQDQLAGFPAAADAAISEGQTWRTDANDIVARRIKLTFVGTGGEGKARVASTMGSY